MPLFCSQCGKNVESGAVYCPACGAAVAEGAASSPEIEGPRQEAAGENGRALGSGSLGLDSRVGGVLAYLFGIVSGVALLAFERKDRLVRFHAAQSVVLWIAAMGMYLAGALTVRWPLVLVFGRLGRGLWGLGVSVAGLGLFVLWILCMSRAWNRERWRIPVVGDLAESLLARFGAGA